MYVREIELCENNSFSTPRETNMAALQKSSNPRVPFMNKTIAFDILIKYKYI